jgi:DNA-binding NarL/FixJ family response regulator
MDFYKNIWGSAGYAECVRHLYDRRGRPARRNGTTRTGALKRGGAMHNGGPIRVMLVDDHQIMREILSLVLGDEPDMTVVAEAGDGETAVELARSIQPDVIVMDVTMPRMNGVEATRRITAELPATLVIGMSMHEPQDMATAMLRAGAAAYLTKDGPAEELVRSIRVLRQGLA